jgi:hypothetical protein
MKINEPEEFANVCQPLGPLARPLYQPVKQARIDRGLRQPPAGPKMQPRLRRQGKRTCSGMADEEEAFTTPIPLKRLPPARAALLD